jgi:drug/metabolite transporter (DMT)-like permease
LSRLKTLAQLNLSTFLIAFSALYSKLLPLPPSLIICGRCLFAVLALGVYLPFKKRNLKLNSVKSYWIMLIAGVLLSIHWTTYYLSIQTSSVAIGVISLYTFPVITSFVEPFFFKKKIIIADVAAAILVLTGIFIILPLKTLDQNVILGLVYGLISAITYSFRNLVTKKYFSGNSASVSMFYQVLISFILLAPFTGLFTSPISLYQWTQLFILGTLLSAIAHTLFLNSLKRMTVSQASIISGLQPVYAVILAFFILDEKPGINTLAGGILILVSVYLEAFRYYRSSES